ncbi:hypothetical protein K458DRAFT_397404 [Lentithecium fluviatile CBS 122367]|uniref:Uncharacterized protein n=1 Tax=Lentithecium fluviatile CBS 122367 TaxID=1168545 RepID=A0A6G1ICR5_9PLEO|nr:hypothetical protein K458DRAFT_397404 [Lentithecium fluviatile CBS 122367]
MSTSKSQNQGYNHSSFGHDYIAFVIAGAITGLWLLGCIIGFLYFRYRKQKQKRECGDLENEFKEYRCDNDTLSDEPFTCERVYSYERGFQNAREFKIAEAPKSTERLLLRKIIAPIKINSKRIDTRASD